MKIKFPDDIKIYIGVTNRRGMDNVPKICKSCPIADYPSEKRKTNSRKPKDMAKKGQLENIDL